MIIWQAKEDGLCVLFFMDPGQNGRSTPGSETKRATILKPFKVLEMMVAYMEVSHSFNTYYNGYLHTLCHGYNRMKYKVIRLDSVIHIFAWFSGLFSTVHACCRPAQDRSDVAFIHICNVFGILFLWASSGTQFGARVEVDVCMNRYDQYYYMHVCMYVCMYVLMRTREAGP